MSTTLDFMRIQVKSTQFFDRGCYPCAVRGSQWRYADNAFDFLAVYVLPEDIWYIIPKRAFWGQASVALRPACENSKYAKYLGAWELLKQEALMPDLADKDSTSVSDVLAPPE